MSKRKLGSPKSPNPRLYIDLVEVFKKAYSDKSKEFRSKILPTLKTPAFKDLFSRNVIERIQDRTKAGIDKDDQNFRPYAKSYIKSDVFRIYGKSQKPNLTMSGEMLASLANKRSSGTVVALEFIEDNRAKAFGHITGMEGHPWLDGVTPARDFFGLPEEEQVEIFKETMKQVRQLAPSEYEEIAATITSRSDNFRIYTDEI